MAIDISKMTDAEIDALDIDALTEEELGEETTDEGATDDLSTEDDEEDKEGEPDSEEEEEGSEGAESGEEDSEDGSAEEDKEAESDGKQSPDDKGGDESPDDGAEDAVDEEAPEKDSKDSKDKSDTSVEDSAKIEAYDSLMGKFRANGVDIQAKSVDDALNLMKMGANYHKKMVAIKPYMATGRTLEKHNIDEERLNFLIDLHNGDAKAITKLVKDSKVDPLSIDVETDTSYKSKSYKVSDEEVNLTSALDDVQGTPTGDRTIDIISNKWDKASGDFIATKPEILTIINDHVAGGYYDKIMEEVERQKVFGKLDGLSSYEAYQKVGNELFSQEASAKAKEQETVVKTRRKVTTDSKVKAKKRAASTKKAVSKSEDETFDITKMSDDDIEALVASGKYD